MADTGNPSDSADKFMLRLPDGMRSAIAAEARRNKRSMNAEIVALLQERFPLAATGPAVTRAEALLEEQCGLLREILAAVRGKGDAAADPG